MVEPAEPDSLGIRPRAAVVERAGTEHRHQRERVNADRNPCSRGHRDSACDSGDGCADEGVLVVGPAKAGSGRACPGLIWWKGSHGSFGLVRVLATIVPLVVLSTVFGLALLLRRNRVTGHWIWAALLLGYGAWATTDLLVRMHIPVPVAMREHTVVEGVAVLEARELVEQRAAERRIEETVDRDMAERLRVAEIARELVAPRKHCLLYTSDAADDLLCVDLGGRRIIKKKKRHTHPIHSDRNI